MKNDNIILQNGLSTILHSLIIPVFSFVFVIMYDPYGLKETLAMGGKGYTFNLTIIFCIVLGSISLSRAVMYIIRKRYSLSNPLYAAWCMGETIISALFISLYAVLMMKGGKPFFEIAGTSLGIFASICIYPYAFLFICFTNTTERKDESRETDSTTLVRFHDEYKKLRFVIAPEAILFIRSEENYVVIHYTDQDKIKSFNLRSSMKALEEQLFRHGLVRCHRSYFINPKHVKMVHRDSSGIIVADMKSGNFDSIPVSRKYYDELTKLL